MASMSSGNLPTFLSMKTSGRSGMDDAASSPRVYIARPAAPAAPAPVGPGVFTPKPRGVFADDGGVDVGCGVLREQDAPGAEDHGVDPQAAARGATTGTGAASHDPIVAIASPRFRDREDERVQSVSSVRGKGEAPSAVTTARSCARFAGTSAPARRSTSACAATNARRRC